MLEFNAVESTQEQIMRKLIFLIIILSASFYATPAEGADAASSGSKALYNSREAVKMTSVYRLFNNKSLS